MLLSLNATVVLLSMPALSPELGIAWPAADTVVKIRDVRRRMRHDLVLRLRNEEPLLMDFANECVFQYWTASGYRDFHEHDQMRMRMQISKPDDQFFVFTHRYVGDQLEDVLYMICWSEEQQVNVTTNYVRSIRIKPPYQRQRSRSPRR